MRSKKYTIQAKLWIYPGPVPWHFVTIDKKESSEIKEKYGKIRRGFGSIPVSVTVGETGWNTSVFPNKDGTYLLPIKASVRKKENIFEDDTTTMILEFK